MKELNDVTHDTIIYYLYYQFILYEIVFIQKNIYLNAMYIMQL